MQPRNPTPSDPDLDFGESTLRRPAGEPWFYRWIEIIAYALLVLGTLLNILWVALVDLASTSLPVSDARAALFVGVVIRFFAYQLGIMIFPMLLLIASDIGRSLRELLRRRPR